MYGWRARIGVLVPSGNVVTEPEFNLILPEGVTCHYSRFRFTGEGTAKRVLEDLRAAMEHIADASALVSHVQPSAMVMTGTGVTFIGGYGYDRMLIAKMQEKNGGLPTTTTSTSVIEALKRLGIKKLSIGMPYIEEVARTAVRFVEDNDLEVLKAKWLNKRGFEISMVTADELAELAGEVDSPESEAVFMSCTALHTVASIEQLEKRLKKPVVTSNQATIWNALRLAGIDDKIEGYGRLLSTC